MTVSDHACRKARKFNREHNRLLISPVLLHRGQRAFAPTTEHLRVLITVYNVVGKNVPRKRRIKIT